MRTYWYSWEAWVNNKLVDQGVVERTYDKMIEYHGSCDIVKLVQEWNRIAELQFSFPEINNHPKILWKYFNV